MAKVLNAERDVVVAQVPAGMKLALIERARLEDRTLSAFIRRALQERLEAGEQR